MTNPKDRWPKNTKRCTHLHAYGPQELKQRLGPVFRVLFALFESVAFVHQRLDLAKLERAYSITAFDHPLPDAAGIHGGHQYHVTFLSDKHKKRTGSVISEDTEVFRGWSVR